MCENVNAATSQRGQNDARTEFANPRPIVANRWQSRSVVVVQKIAILRWLRW
jgi:hypothetical protein